VSLLPFFYFRLSAPPPPVISSFCKERVRYSVLGYKPGGRGGGEATLFVTSVMVRAAADRAGTFRCACWKHDLRPPLGPFCREHETAARA